MTMGLPCDREGYDLRSPQCPKCGSRGCPQLHRHDGKCSADKPAPQSALATDKGTAPARCDVLTVDDAGQVEFLARVMAFAKVGDPNAKDIKNGPRWKWFVDDAKRYLQIHPGLFASLISSAQPLPPDWKQDQAETSRLAPKRPLCSCKASARDGQHMAWCPVISSTEPR